MIPRNKYLRNTRVSLFHCNDPRDHYSSYLQLGRSPRVCEVPLQHHCRFQQNFYACTFTPPSPHSFRNAQLCCSRHFTPPLRKRRVVGCKLLGHPGVVKRRPRGFPIKVHVSGCDVDHERGLQARCDLVHGFYPVECLRFDKIQRILNGSEQPCNIQGVGNVFRNRSSIVRRRGFREVVVGQGPPPG